MMEESQEGQPGGITRRQALKRAGVAGAAVVWATPVVQTINMSTASAQTQSAVIKNEGDTALTSLTLRYLGGGTAHGTAPPCDGDGTASGTPVGLVTVYAQWGSGGSACRRMPVSDCTPGGSNAPDLIVPDVAVGEILSFPEAGITAMQPRICLLVVDADGNCTLTKIHTSCSVPIIIDGICGQWQVVDGTN
jgi:hypothetical protein